MGERIKSAAKAAKEKTMQALDKGKQKAVANMSEDMALRLGIDKDEVASKHVGAKYVDDSMAPKRSDAFASLLGRLTILCARAFCKWMCANMLLGTSVAIGPLTTNLRCPHTHSARTSADTAADSEVVLATTTGEPATTGRRKGVD